MGAKEQTAAPLRELFIEELGGVTGDGDPLDKVALWQWLKDQLFQPSTMACGEEGPC